MSHDEAMEMRSRTNELRRRNFADAAMQGVQQMASQYGAKVIGLNDRGGFVIVFPNDDRMHFDLTEL